MTLESLNVGLLETNVDGDTVVSGRFANLNPCIWGVMNLLDTIVIAAGLHWAAQHSFSQEAGEQE